MPGKNCFCCSQSQKGTIVQAELSGAQESLYIRSSWGDAKGEGFKTFWKPMIGWFSPAFFNPKPTDMIIRLGRLTPGYFHLLQRQVAGEVQTQPQDRSLNQIAMMLAIIGLSLSSYSAKQMTEKVRHGPVP